MPLSIFGRILPLLIAVAIIGPLGCSRSTTPPIAKTEILEVSVANPLQQMVTKTSDYLATLDAAETVKLQSRVTGYLNEIRFTAGKEVKKGEVLFVIDKRPFDVDLKKAQADVKSATAQLTYAKKEVARLSRGLSNQSVSREDFEKSEASVAVADAQVEVANSSVDRAKLNLEYCEVRSPIDGRVSRESVTVGNLVQADSTTLTTIVSKDPIYAYFDVDQRSVLEYLEATQGKRAKVEEGELFPIRMALENDVGFPHEGTINFAENRLNPETGALKLRAVFEQSKVKTELLPGYTARIRVPGPKPFSAILIPDRAIGTDQDRKFVYVVNAENKVEYRVVTLGILVSVQGYEVRVISDGLTASDRIIVNGMQSVRQGITVTPKPVHLLTEVPLGSAASKKE